MMMRSSHSWPKGERPDGARAAERSSEMGSEWSPVKGGKIWIIITVASIYWAVTLI